MKIFKWLFILCLISTACKQEKNYESIKSEIQNDKNFKKYVATQVIQITNLNRVIAKEKMVSYDEGKIKEAFKSVKEAESANLEASQKTLFHYYGELYKEYILKEKVTREQIKSIIREAVTTELNLRKNIAAN